MLIGNCGRRFQGKTTLAVATLDELERRAMLDPRGQIRRAGSVVVRTKEKLRVAFDALAAGDVCELVYSPIEEHETAFEAFAAELRRWVLEYPELELGVLIDEATFYRGGRLDTFPAFMYVVKSCSLAHFHIVITCHRPTDLPVDVRALMNRWCLFRTTQEHDLEAIKKRCTAPVVDLVQTLDDMEWIEWNDDEALVEEHRLAFIWRTDLAPPKDAPHILILQ